MDKIHKIIIVSILVFLALIFAYTYISLGGKRYVIKNNYYGFQIETPSDWIAEKDSFYTEENISEILNDCTNDKEGLGLHKIGSFKFSDQKKLSDLSSLDLLPPDTPKGALLTIEINCIPEVASGELIDYSFSNIKIGGEKAFQAFFNSLTFGAVKHFSFVYGGLQYKIEQYVYIPSGEKSNEERIRSAYSKIFDNIVSSFKLITPEI